MTALYELTDNMQRLRALEDEMDPEVFQDTMDSISDSIEDKAVGYAAVISEFKNDQAELDAEIKRLQARKKAIGNNIDRMKGNLIEAFHVAGIDRVKDARYTVKVNKGRESVQITDETKLPVDCYEPQPPKVSKTKVKELLEKGRQIDGAQMVRHESLSIR